jgi:hypothetical protein
MPVTVKAQLKRLMRQSESDWLAHARLCTLLTNARGRVAEGGQKRPPSTRTSASPDVPRASPGRPRG